MNTNEFNKLCDKAEALVHIVYIKKILTLNPQKYAPMINNLLEQLLLIKQYTTKIDDLHSKKIELAEETQELIEKFAVLNQKADNLESLVDTKFPNNVLKQDDTLETASENSTFNDSVGLTPAILNPNIKAHPVRLFLEILPITYDEFKTIPKYMLLSLKLNEINEFIEKLNGVYSAKYAILSKKLSQLKGQDRILYNEYKNKESPALKGLTWITEGCIANAFELKKLDKRRLQIATVLRHLKRISEKRYGSEKYYIVL